MTSTRNETRLVTDIAKMIGQQTYNHAPINYSIAEKAIVIVHRRRVRPLEKALREIRALVETYADRGQIIAIIDGLLGADE